MPRKRVPCPVCGNPMGATSEKCRKCKPSYVRTELHRQKMSKVQKGKPKPYLKGRKRPEHSRLMKEWWTPERRNIKREEMLKLNPSAHYHGLSATSAKRIVDAVSHCEICNSEGSDSRLGVHHRNGNKHDHSLLNLIVLCHCCHMKEHAKRKETGWDSYWKKRKNPQC